MKKVVILVALMVAAVVSANAQILRAEELEEYAKERYGDKWVDAAANLGAELTLDKNNALTYVQVIEAPGKSKEELYILLNYWFTATFNDANSVINLNDKELGTIIAQGFVGHIAEHRGPMNNYHVHLKPVIKCDIKENKIRVTYTVPFYYVDRYADGGYLGKGDNATQSIQENWVLDECYPFTSGKDSHKKTSSKALIMAHAYSNVVMDKIEECVKNGLTGNEGDDW